MGHLYGKLANICADISGNPIKNVQILKQLTGGDTVQSAVKFYSPIQFMNTAKLIFSCNELPPTNDEGGWHRRQLVINFPNEFTAEKGNVDQNILDKITTPAELSGLLNESIRALQMLLTNKRFTGEESIKKKRETYTLRSNPVKYFAETYLEQSENPFEQITKAELHSTYVKFCEEMRVRPMGSTHFSRALNKYRMFGGEAAPYIENVKTRVWYGIKCTFVEKDPPPREQTELIELLER